MKNKKTPDQLREDLEKELLYLKLPFMSANCQTMADEAAKNERSHLDFLSRMVKAEAEERRKRAMERRIRSARFPVIKTMDQFKWSWPRKINKLQVDNLFRLHFIKEKGNVIFLGGVGLGKSHIATAMGYAACLKGYSVLFTSAIDIINTLSAAHNTGRFQTELKKYLRPELLIMDELGYLPIDKAGADLLFQIISYRYERGAMIITSNRAYIDWPEIFNHDSTLTSALLDRVLHHAQTVLIEGKSYRMKDRIESNQTEPPSSTPG